MENEISIRDRIIEESLKLFKTISYSKASVSDIASAVGISKGAIYLHFKSKEEIFAAIMDMYIHKSGQKMEQDIKLLNGTIEENITTVCVKIVDHFLQIKNLLFGSFDNVKGRTIREVLLMAEQAQEMTISFFKNVLVYSQVELDKSKEEQDIAIGEFIQWLKGRIINFFIINDWDNAEDLKKALQTVSFKVFEAVVIK